MATVSSRRLPSLVPALISVDNGEAPVPIVDSPNSNPCKVKTAGRRYRNDPYKARVVSSDPMPTPMPPQQQAVAPTPPEMAMPKKPAARLPPMMTAAEPTNGTELPAPRRKAHPPNASAQQYATVQFKRSVGTFLHAGGLGVQDGDLVVVDGDRGEHMGIVTSTVARRPKAGHVGQIVRRATAIDYAHIDRVQHDEAEALATCRQYAEQVGLYGVMNIVDVEFQMDYGKLTIFFLPCHDKQFVDFRKLQRVLFQHFRCRIWLVDA